MYNGTNKQKLKALLSQCDIFDLGYARLLIDQEIMKDTDIPRMEF